MSHWLEVLMGCYPCCTSCPLPWVGLPVRRGSTTCLFARVLPGVGARAVPAGTLLAGIVPLKHRVMAVRGRP